MKSIAETKNNYLTYLKAFVFLSPFLFGGFHIWTSAVVSLVLAVGLFLMCKEKIKITFSLPLFSVVLIPIAYLVVSLWAIDSGTAVYGFVKFLPIALFALVAVNLKKEEKNELLDIVPYSAAVMGVLSYGLSFIPSLSEYFLVASRLGGFFQYPNSFACYCLTGIPILMLKEKLSLKSWLVSALLVGIIFLTGSRTVFVMLAVVSVLLLIKINAKNKIRFLAFAGIVGTAVMLTILLTGNMQTVGRFLTISLESSTLLGRLLYYKDALPVILKNPFGLGYYGYYFSQGSFQNGVYSVAFVHNDFLQLLLDIGWVPSVLFTVAVIKSFLSSKSSAAEKTVLFIIAVHSLFDFDLQFISVLLLLVLTLDYEGKTLFSLKLSRGFFAGVLASLVLISSYFGAVNGLFLMGDYEKVEKIYGKDTQSQIFLMSEEKDYEKINDYADSILSRNKNVSIAYSAKANYAFRSGDMSAFIGNKEKAIDSARYSIGEYNDYCQKLMTAINMYLKAGDRESAEYCAGKLVGVEDRLIKVKENTDKLAWKIKDKPQLELAEEYSAYISGLKG